MDETARFQETLRRILDDGEEFSEDFLADIKAFVMNTDGRQLSLANLPERWDLLTKAWGRGEIGQFHGAGEWPDGLEGCRWALVSMWIGPANSKRWAWDGLNDLLVMLEDRGEPIPEPLKNWACSVVSRQHTGTFKRPRKPPEKQSNKYFAPEHDRDSRIATMYSDLICAGWPRKKIEEAIMRALDLMDADTVRSVFRKLKVRENYQTDAR